MNTAELQHRVQQAWTQQRWDDWAGTFAQSYRFDLTPGIELNLAQTLAWSEAWFSAFPDYQERVRAVYPTATAVAYELVGTGTSHSELSLLGRALIPAAPGHTFQLEYAKILEFDEDGMVVADRQYLDPQALRSQLSP